MTPVWLMGCQNPGTNLLCILVINWAVHTHTDYCDSHRVSKSQENLKEKMPVLKVNALSVWFYCWCTWVICLTKCEIIICFSVILLFFFFFCRLAIDGPFGTSSEVCFHSYTHAHKTHTHTHTHTPISLPVCNLSA